MTNSDLQYLDPVSQCSLRGLNPYMDAAGFAYVQDVQNGHIHFIGRGLPALEEWCTNVIQGMSTILPSERLHSLAL